MILATYVGECPDCDQPIRPGDPIDQYGDMPWAHTTCPPPPPVTPPCPACWQVPSLSGACGCPGEAT